VDLPLWLAGTSPMCSEAIVFSSGDTTVVESAIPTGSCAEGRSEISESFAQSI
jgi:hypothetical protein